MATPWQWQRSHHQLAGVYQFIQPVQEKKISLHTRGGVFWDGSSHVFLLTMIFF